MRCDVCGKEVLDTDQYVTADGICCPDCFRKARQREMYPAKMTAAQLRTMLQITPVSEQYEQPKQQEQPQQPQQPQQLEQPIQEEPEPYGETEESEEPAEKKSWFLSPGGVITDIFFILMIIVGIANIKGCETPILDGGEHYITMVQECCPGDGDLDWETIFDRNFDDREWDYEKSDGIKHVIFQGIDEDGEKVKIRFRLTKENDNYIIEPDYLSYDGEVVSSLQRELMLGLLVEAS